MPNWADSLTVPDGAATPVNQTYVRESAVDNVWTNDTARSAGNAESFKIRAEKFSKKEGALVVPMIRWNVQWTSKDATDPAATVFNLTLVMPATVSANLTAARKKVKGFITGLLGTILSVDAQRDAASAGRVF